MYQECLNNKFVVFTTDIDLKAHEIDEHGASLSRQQRIRQARVDVDLNYSSSRDSSRRQPKQTKSNNKNVVSLSSEDFPDINGGPSSAQLMTQRMATLQVNKKDDWPSLGDERPLVAETNPPTESSSSSSSSQQAPAISRQAAAFDRIADLFKNVDKSIKFRQYTRQFEEGSISSKKWFELSDELCDKNDTLSEKIFEQTKDLLSSKAKIVELERVWNHKNNPTGSQSPQVLVINPKKPKPVRGTWDKVALAAQDAGGFAINKTPWSSNSRTSSESDLQSLFPALPTSDAHTSRRADISSMIKRNEERYTWGESSSSAANTDAEDNENRQRKKKKGKQVLFRVGL
ncbi:hypothetical protein G6F56_007962 [Rhizopus delemar]|uniref:ZNF598/HEL2 PAH domain-containing protein n=1 Tax=Rhizopus stolonifer TaxID=4846 RepID=A0A367IZS9_RHIST|nr:hypothetical protein G6F56_007962 [Rhizopus delemar]RCH83196.1 hypothetical protein CU098_007553 [Rhizopus stolonifer]